MDRKTKQRCKYRINSQTSECTTFRSIALHIALWQKPMSYIATTDVKQRKATLKAILTLPFDTRHRFYLDSCHMLSAQIFAYGTAQNSFNKSTSEITGIQYCTKLIKKLDGETKKERRTKILYLQAIVNFILKKSPDFIHIIISSLCHTQHLPDCLCIVTEVSPKYYIGTTEQSLDTG